ncbi:hypothetical protein DR950_19000 [Kitasatospora xanthocidica]|uniref:Uncharacterized protein n=1 Tax=Kitasatospora xanthocidica TaxID=83382 RepID=A0A372ZUM4_9ACTN|nr:hypothetical protein [Kitasatospora xanthocidica]RGD59598.1 hypothetical protein DR950_19000 [Kitasatospora xanthocidica]
MTPIGVPDVTETAAPYPFPVVLEVQGLMEPEYFGRLPEAMAALLTAVGTLPLSPDQQGYFAELFGPSEEQSIGRRLATHGEVRALAFLDLTPTVVRLYPAGPGTAQ